MQTDRTETVKSEGGRDRTRPLVAKGGLTDLKTGQRVRDIIGADGKAVKVCVYRPRLPKESNER